MIPKFQQLIKNKKETIVCTVLMFGRTEYYGAAISDQQQAPVESLFPALANGTFSPQPSKIP